MTKHVPDYGPRARIGIAVPHSNPTVEPEIRMTLPDNIGVYATRLTHASESVETRLNHYIRNIPLAINSFGEIRLAAFGFGCTGSSYVAGLENEENFTSKAYNETSVPVITAAQAIRKALDQIGCSSIALVSPYPDWLAELGYEYWESSGLKIMDRIRVDPSLTDTHRIYELTSQDALNQMRKLKETDADCIVASGTGMPTLKAIRTLGSETGIPVLSSNLSLAWALTKIVSPEQTPHLPQDLL